MNITSGEPVYNHLGHGYARQRRADPRWAAEVRSAIGGAGTVVNVGAGTGSSEPDDVESVAVKPSLVMIAQRPKSAAPVVAGVA